MQTSSEEESVSRLRHKLILLLAILSTGSAPSKVRAADATFIGGLGSLSASATFGTSGTDLLVILTNSSGSDVLVPPEFFSAVYLDIGASVLSLTRSSAIIGTTSTVLFGTTDPG